MFFLSPSLLRRECKQESQKDIQSFTKTTILYLNIWACFWVYPSTQASVAQPCELCSFALPAAGERSIQERIPLSDTWHQQSCRLVCTCLALLTQAPVSANSEQSQLPTKPQALQNSAGLLLSVPGCLQVTVPCIAQPPFLHLQASSKLCGLCLEAGCES